MNRHTAASNGVLDRLTQRLLWRALTSKAVLRYFTTRVLNTTNSKIRARLFRMLGQVPGADFAYVNIGPERYLVNCHDHTISRIVFTTGAFEFEKFETALRLLRHHTSIKSLDLLVDVGANIGTVCIPAVARGRATQAKPARCAR
jgi:hypothetical protein